MFYISFWYMASRLSALGKKLQHRNIYKAWYVVGAEESVAE